MSIPSIDVPPEFVAAAVPSRAVINVLAAALDHDASHTPAATAAEHQADGLALLHQEHDFTAAVLETLSSLVVVFNRQGQIIRFNRACEQTTGYTFAEVRGRPIWDVLLAPEDAARAGDLCRYHKPPIPSQPRSHLDYTGWPAPPALMRSALPRRPQWQSAPALVRSTTF